ncbi:MAG: hypothetical protein ACTSWG_03135 [Candidatus Helarchaeota archaeon]
MNNIFKVTIDDYLEVVKRCQDKGIKPGESMKKEFLAYMKEKEIKPIGKTELNKQELIKEYNSHGKKILEGEINSKGQTKYKIHDTLDN